MAQIIFLLDCVALDYSFPIIRTSWEFPRDFFIEDFFFSLNDQAEKGLTRLRLWGSMRPELCLLTFIGGKHGHFV